MINKNVVKIKEMDMKIISSLLLIVSGWIIFSGVTDVGVVKVSYSSYHYINLLIHWFESMFLPDGQTFRRGYEILKFGGKAFILGENS